MFWVHRNTNDALWLYIFTNGKPTKWCCEQLIFGSSVAMSRIESPKDLVYFLYIWHVLDARMVHHDGSSMLEKGKTFQAHVPCHVKCFFLIPSFQNSRSTNSLRAGSSNSKPPATQTANRQADRSHFSTCILMMEMSWKTSRGQASPQHKEYA